MRYFIITASCLLIFAAVIQAETMYINDIVKITLRTGPGFDHKIIATIHSGQDVEVIKPDDEWALFRLPSGKEGWVYSRLLTYKKPNCLILEHVKMEYEALMAQSASVLDENEKLKAENKKLDSELAIKEKLINTLSKSYETLKVESADFLKLKSKFNIANSKLVEQTKKAEKFEEKLIKLERHHGIRWFLTGVGVLLFGFLIGFSTKRQRGRSFLL